MAVTIQIKDDTWTILKNMKVKPSETFDEIIKKLISNELESTKQSGG